MLMPPNACWSLWRTHYDDTKALDAGDCVAFCWSARAALGFGPRWAGTLLLRSLVAACLSAGRPSGAAELFRRAPD